MPKLTRLDHPISGLRHGKLYSIQEVLGEEETILTVHIFLELQCTVSAAAKSQSVSE